MKKRFKKIYIEILNSCNLNCPFCSKDNNESKVMTLEQFNYIAKQIKKYSDYIYLHVKGEPLMHPNLKEILECSYDNDLYVNITTNGTRLALLDDVLLNSKSIRQINVSLHALINLPIKDQEIYLNEVCKLAKEVSQNKQFFLSLRLWIKNEKLNKYIINYLNEKLNITIGENEKILPNVYMSFDEEFDWPNLNNNFVSNTGRCLATKDQIAILVNGDVIPCCLDSNGIIKFGNIFTEDLDTILSSDRFINMQKGFMENKIIEELCQKCTYRLRFK